DPTIDPDEVLLETYDALQRVMTERGVDLRYGRLLTGRLRANGRRRRRRGASVHAPGRISRRRALHGELRAAAGCDGPVRTGHERADRRRPSPSGRATANRSVADHVGRLGPAALKSPSRVPGSSNRTPTPPVEQVVPTSERGPAGWLPS